MTFLELQNEVARRGTRNNSTQFTTAIKNVINAALLRIGRDAYWRVLRRKATFETVTSYTEGSGAVTATNGSKAVTITGATLITDGVQPGRMITIEGSNKIFEIATITGETTLTIDQNFDGTTDTDLTYEILPQEEYNLPVQVTHRCFLWHEDYGMPFRMHYLQDQDFYDMGLDRSATGTSTHYRMWGANNVIQQLKEASVISIVSSSASDTTQQVTVFGTVSGYPDQETINLNGTTAAAGSKSFSSVERIVRDGATVGRVTVSANTGNTTVSVLPVGDNTDGIIYRKVQLYPLPDDVFPIHVQYYKDVYPLVNDDDVHELGPDFDEAIICLAASKIQLETGQQEGVNFAAMFADELKSLKKTNVDKIDYSSVLRRGGTSTRKDPMVHPYVSYRQMGGWFGPSVR